MKNIHFENVGLGRTAYAKADLDLIQKQIMDGGFKLREWDLSPFVGEFLEVLRQWDFSRLGQAKTILVWRLRTGCNPMDYLRHTWFSAISIL
jgi:hypothetical protein